MSPAVIVNIVQVCDLLLLLFSGLAAKAMLMPLLGLRSGGSLFLATVTASLFLPPSSPVQILTCSARSVRWASS